jgi:hypothetical protein
MLRDVDSGSLGPTKSRRLLTERTTGCAPSPPEIQSLAPYQTTPRMMMKSSFCIATSGPCSPTLRLTTQVTPICPVSRSFEREYKRALSGIRTSVALIKVGKCRVVSATLHRRGQSGEPTCLIRRRYPFSATCSVRSCYPYKMTSLSSAQSSKDCILRHTRVRSRMKLIVPLLTLQ